MKEEKACFVIGNRNISITEIEKQNLLDHFINLIEKKNVIYFYFGGFGEFDDLCHEIITESQKTFPQIKRIYVFDDEKTYYRPYKWPKWLKNEDYEDFAFFTLSFDWWYQRIYFRNCAIIDHSDYVITYIRNTKNSGAYKAYEYARKKHKNIINI